MTLAEQLKSGEIEARQVFGDDEDETERPRRAETKEDKRADAFLKHVGELRRLASERDEARRPSAARPKTLEDAAKREREALERSTGRSRRRLLEMRDRRASTSRRSSTS